MTSGVLPVPPTLRLPTITTGAPTRRARIQPCAYAPRRAAVAAAYSQPSGCSSAAPALSLYHRRSSRCRIAPASVGELQAVELRVQSAARQQLGVRAALDDRAGLENDDAVGLLHRRQAMRDDEG